MMADWTPSEIELLEYVEGELDAAAAERVRAAVAASPELTRIVADLERGRDALRRAPTLELPQASRRRIVESLPRQEGGDWSLAGLRASPRRLLVVLTPVAAAVVAAIALTSTLGDGDQRDRTASGGETVAAQTAAAEGGSAFDSAAPEAAGAPIASVKGPAKDVAKLLRAKGFEAKAVNGAVEVTGADPAGVQEALADRAEGPVAVLLVP